MSISTKKGDSGQTSLWSGELVWKSDERVEAYGTLDELDAHIGESRHYVQYPQTATILLEVQNDLYKVMGHLASLSKEYVLPLTIDDAERLTNYVHEYEEILQLRGFVVPGNTIPSAKIDICRTVVRRAERRIISLSRVEEVEPAVIQYVNRLSDLFFVMARMEEKLVDKIQYKHK